MRGSRFDFNEWVQAVAPTAEREARAQFEEWKAQNKQWADALGPDDVRLELLCGPDFNAMRVLVPRRKDA